MTSITGALLLFDVLGLAAGVWLALRVLGSFRPLRDLGWLGLFGLLLATVGWLVGTGAFHDRFAVLNLWCHAIFVVLGPVLLLRAVVVLRAGERGDRGWGVLGCVVAVVVLGVGGFAYFVEPYRLQVRHYRLESARLAGIPGPIRVVVLADLQTDEVGAFEREVFARVDALRPDLLLLPGDWLQLPLGDPGFEAQRAKLVELFRGLEHPPRYGMYAVDGDVEEARQVLRGTGVTILQDQCAPCDPVSRLQVFGLRRWSSRQPAGPGSAWDEAFFKAQARFDGLTILLGHSPDFARGFFEGVSTEVLAVAGHTHGGQVVVPFYGPPITLSDLPRDVAAGGFFRFGDAALCVSRGVGMERAAAPRLRFLCPPELVVIDLTAPGP
ncbi:MAG: hypothetical protein R3F30_11640 [Planctomycetota bacterium]